MGTGDGRGAARLARAEPDALVVGIDASIAPLAEASRRAASPMRRGGLPNLLFLRASAEQPPAGLVGRVDRLRVAFPWGSLVRGVLGRDDSVLRGLVSLLRVGAEIEVLTSVLERDVAGVGLPAGAAHDVDAIANAWQDAGLALTVHRAATDEEVRASGSTWARRLTAAGRREVVRIAGYRAGAERDGQRDGIDSRPTRRVDGSKSARSTKPRTVGG